MQAWIKLIGSSDKPITEHPFYGNYKQEYIGFRKSNRPGIRKDDQMFLYAPGGSKSIFALAEAVADPEHDPDYSPVKDGSCRWRIRVRYIFNLPVDSGISIDEISKGSRNITRSICQQSHIRLLPDEYELVLFKMKEKSP